MKVFPEELQNKISIRKEDNSFRTLETHHSLVDFTSNDYLGFSFSKAIQKQAKTILKQEKFTNGSTGSRLVSGTHNGRACSIGGLR